MLGLAARAADVKVGLAGQSCTSEGDLHQGHWWGFCSMRSLPSACRLRVAPLMLQFPLFGGGEVAVRGGVAPKVQTTSAKRTPGN